MGNGALYMEELNRWYMGIWALRMYSQMSPMKTALYECLEDRPNRWKKGDLICAPVRLCWRHKKLKKEVK